MNSASPVEEATVERDRPVGGAERSRRHREKRRTDDCGRLDVWISNGLLHLLRQLASVHGRALEQEVHDAVAWYVRRRLDLPISEHLTMTQALEAVECYRNRVHAQATK